MKESYNKLIQINSIFENVFYRREGIDDINLLSSAYKVSASLRDGLFHESFDVVLGSFFKSVREFFDSSADQGRKLQAVKFLFQIAQYLRAENVFVKHRSDNHDSKSKITENLDQVILKFENIAKELKAHSSLSQSTIDLETQALKGDTKILERYDALKERRLFDGNLSKLAMNFHEVPDLFIDQENVSSIIFKDAKKYETHADIFKTILEQPVEFSEDPNKMKKIFEYRSKKLAEIFEINSDQDRKGVFERTIREYFENKLHDLRIETDAKAYAIIKFGLMFRFLFLSKAIEQSKYHKVSEDAEQLLIDSLGHPVYEYSIGLQFDITCKAFKFENVVDFDSNSKESRQKLKTLSQEYQEKLGIVDENAKLRDSVAKSGQRIIELEALTNQLSLSKTDLLNRLSASEELAQSSQRQSQEYQLQVADLQKDNQIFVRDNEEKKAEIDRLRSEINGLMFQDGVAKGEKEILFQENQQLRLENDDLKLQSQFLNQQISELRESVKSLTTQNQDSQRIIEAQGVEISRLSSEGQENAKALSSVQEQMLRIQEQMRAMETQIVEKQELIEELSRESREKENAWAEDNLERKMVVSSNYGEDKGGLTDIVLEFKEPNLVGKSEQTSQLWSAASALLSYAPSISYIPTFPSFSSISSREKSKSVEADKLKGGGKTQESDLQSVR